MPFAVRVQIRIAVVSVTEFGFLTRQPNQYSRTSCFLILLGIFVVTIIFQCRWKSLSLVFGIIKSTAWAAHRPCLNWRHKQCVDLQSYKWRIGFTNLKMFELAKHSILRITFKPNAPPGSKPWQLALRHKPLDQASKSMKLLRLQHRWLNQILPKFPDQLKRAWDRVRVNW